MSLCGLALSFNNALCELGDPILQPCCFRECFSLHRCGFGDHQTGNLGHDGGTRRTRVRIRRPTSPLQTRRRGVPAFATPDDIRSGTLGVAQCIHTSLAVRGERGDQHDPDQREDADGEPGDAFDGGEGTDAQTHSAPPRSGGRGCDGHGRKGHGRQVECPHVEIAIVRARHGEDRHGRQVGMEEGRRTAPLDSRRPPSPQPQPPWLLALGSLRCGRSEELESHFTTAPISSKLLRCSAYCWSCCFPPPRPPSCRHRLRTSACTSEPCVVCVFMPRVEP